MPGTSGNALSSPGTRDAGGNPIVAYRFGPYRLRLQGRILERDGTMVPVTPKVADTLLVLLERAGEVLSKEELMAAIWPDVTVAESGLTRNIAVLRQALGEGSGACRYIETVPRRGYRFGSSVDVERVETEPAGEPDAGPAAGFTRRASGHAPGGAAVAARFRGWWPLAVLLMAMGLSVAAWETLRHTPPAVAAAANPDVAIGRHLLAKLTPSETLRAREYFERAVQANPALAEAHAGLAISAIQLMGLAALDPEQAARQSRIHAARALELDPHSGMALAATGAASILEPGEWPKAESHFRRALQVEPRSVVIRFVYSHLKLSQGDVAAARALLEEALRLDPASPVIGTQYGAIFYFQQDFPRAVSELRRVLDREPDYSLAHYYLAMSLGFLGNVDDGLQHLDRARLNPEVIATDRAWLLAMRGDDQPARELLLERIHRVSQGEFDPSVNLILAVTVGDADAVTRAIEATVALHPHSAARIRTEPRLRAIWDHPQLAGLPVGAGL